MIFDMEVNNKLLQMISRQIVSINGNKGSSMEKGMKHPANYFTDRRETALPSHEFTALNENIK
jgi:hypothetical protein